MNTMLAPSFRLLYPNGKLPPPGVAAPAVCGDEQYTAFIGADTGFLPPEPLTALPPPFDVWEHAAKALPFVCRSGTWEKYITCLPTEASPAFAVKDIPQRHLLRANACFGFIAHAVAVVGGLPVPSHIHDAWACVCHRLERPGPCLLGLDSIVYNFALGEWAARDVEKNVDTGSATTQVRDPWTETTRPLSITRTTTEENFSASIRAISFAERTLPGAVARAQQATVDDNPAALRTALAHMLECIEVMTIAFQSADVRPLSDRYLDHVEFTRCTAALSTAVRSQERTASGLLFPAMQLLDAFFERKSYRTEIGQLAIEDRDSLPILIKKLYVAVREVSVWDYIQEMRNGGARAELQALFQRVFDSFASDSGFLAKHRIRINGFIEIGFKVGRLATASGVPSPTWQKRTWRAVNSALLASLHERIDQYPHSFSTVVVESTQTEHGNRAKFLSLRPAGGAFVFKPGDHVAILPENSDQLVADTIQVLRMSPVDEVVVTNPAWLTHLHNHGVLNSCRKTQVSGKDAFSVPVATFFRLAALQPLERSFVRKLVDKMFITSPPMMLYFSGCQISNVPLVLRLLQQVSMVSFKHLASDLDDLFSPMSPRLYSIASNMQRSPGTVQLFVGDVTHQMQTCLSFANGRPPWRQTKEELPHLELGKSEAILKQFVNVSSKQADDRGERRNSENLSQPLAGNRALAELTNLLKEQQDSSLVREVKAKAISRAQVVLSQLRAGGTTVKAVKGVSSSYLWRLSEGDNVRVRIEPNLDFHLPQDNSIPVVMIGLGTGGAPFRSFMSELIVRKQALQNGESARQAWLILGARAQADIPFKQDIEDAYCKHRAIDFSIALSREDSDLDEESSMSELKFKTGSRKHVEDLFEDEALSDKLWRIISSKGHVYTCGRPQVERILRKIISSMVKKYVLSSFYLPFLESGQNLDQYAKEFPDRMAANRRLHIDTYYSGKAEVTEERYKPSEVASHNTILSCWVTFRGAVYNISDYLQIHPGGPKILFDKGGRDMTTDFNIAHGESDFRAASMIEPYRIGAVESFHKANKKIQHFMNCWSVPFLHEALEHQSVFLLDRNVFPELNEPADFLKWKSHLLTERGTKSMARKVWDTYEVDVFNLLLLFLVDDEKGNAKWLREISNQAGMSLRLSLIHEKLLSVRSAAGFPKNTERDEIHIVDEAHTVIDNAQIFHEKLVRLCIAIQRLVEDAMQQSALGAPFENVSKVMMANLLKTTVSGIADLYSAFRK